MTTEYHDGRPDERVFQSLAAREELWPAIRRGRRRRNLLAGAFGLVLLYGAAAAYAAWQGVDWEGVFSWPGPILLLLPALFLLGVVLVFSPLQVKDELKKEQGQRLFLSELGFRWETPKGVRELRWHHVKGVYAFRGPGAHRVLISFVGGNALVGTDWLPVDEPLPEVRTPWGRPLLRGEDGAFHDPRRTPPEDHPITRTLLAHTGLELR